MPDIEAMRAALRYEPSTGEIYRVATGERTGFLSSNRYLNVSACGRTMLAHRVAWFLTHGELSTGSQVDHINGVKTDNRLDNLRLTNDRTNSWNKAMRVDNSLGHKNVYADRVAGGYRVKVTRDGKTYRRRFRVLDEAVAYARSFAVRNDGFFANEGEFAERDSRVRDVATAFAEWRERKAA